MNEKRNKRGFPISKYQKMVAFLAVVVFSFSCSSLQKPKPETYYGENIVPLRQEFRWSNGKMPQTLDPAFATAAPEADIVRAIYEGLTDIDSKTLETVPALASSWEASADHKKWTFFLRKDARWANGEKITAKYFVKSWQRLADFGEKLPDQSLLKNISGVKIAENDDSFETDVDTFKNPNKETVESSKSKFLRNETTKPLKVNKLAVVARNEDVLEVVLEKADEKFPSLVAHPIFRPIYNENEFAEKSLNAGIVTNGAFRIVSVGKDGITLDKADYYWNKEKVGLERVKFIPAENSEKALQFYKSGEIDAVTNAAFEPLALKLLNPYLDVRRTTHSALNYYEINIKRPPFNDVRVRRALAVAIERERITEDEMDGATEPALSFLPFVKTYQITEDVSQAQQLLATAGFPNGENFPTIQLVVNRNDMQKRVARVVAKMWKKNLNVETEIIIKEKNEIESARNNGEYDLIRRGMVLPTNNETVSLLTIFSTAKESPAKTSETVKKDALRPENSTVTGVQNSNVSINDLNELTEENLSTDKIEENIEVKPILSEAEAINELPSIPLYFPTSYSLVKPYVEGFETNVLDAPSLKIVKINNSWQPTDEKVKRKDN